MCYYDMYKFACGDWKWHHFRAHCNREYRTGETCGMKLVMQTVPVREKCKFCDKLDTKKRRKAQEMDRIARWRGEGGRFSASIEKSEKAVMSLEREIRDLMGERDRRMRTF